MTKTGFDSALLRDFLKWAKARPKGSLCAAGIIATRASEIIFAPPDSELSVAERKDLLKKLDESFELFLRFGDGSALGLWTGEGGGISPVVFLGTEGSYLQLAPDLTTFLNLRAGQKFRNHDELMELLPERVYQEMDGAGEEELSRLPAPLSLEMQSWLKAKKMYNASVRSVVREFKAKAFNELKNSIYFIPEERLGKNAVEDDIRTPRMDDVDDPSCLAIGKSLLPLGCEEIQVYVAGNKMIFRVGTQEEVAEKKGDVSLDLPQKIAKEIEPFVYELRKDYAECLLAGESPGLWPSASISVMDDGTIIIAPDYETPFPMGYKDFPDELFQADQKACPMPSDEIPVWLKKKLKTKT